MKQVFVGKGGVFVDEVPAPLIDDGEVLVQVAYSCISAGTELTRVKSAGKTIVQKALEKPKNIEKVLSMLQDRGLKRTILKVKSKLGSASTTGYSASGTVIQTGDNVRDIQVRQDPRHAFT